jgi:GNAT superfamily N-acetyltransferase
MSDGCFTKELEMVIRMAEAQDFEQWLPLWKGYQAFYNTVIADEVTPLTWQRLLDPSEPMHCAVAEENGRLVAMVHYIYHRSCWTTGDYCYLQDLFALPEVRGQGVGRALIDHVYTVAAQAGASRVWWLTHETNLDAMYLYDQVADRSGFIQYRKLLS